MLIFIMFAWKLLLQPHLRRHAPTKVAAVALPLLGGGVFNPQAGQGHIVFLDFWASWCEPCKAELPLVEAFAAAHPEVEVVAVDEGDPIAVGTAFAQAHGMKHVAFDPSHTLGRPLGIAGFPTLVGIDANGFVRDHWLGYIAGIGTVLRDAASRYEAERRAKNFAKPATAS